MLSCSGKSLVAINIAALQQFLNSVVPQGKLEGFEIKLDARAKVKSVFAKLENNCLTIYTGAIVSLGADKFPEVADVSSLLMLFAIYGIKKAGMNEDFEVKSTDQGIAEIKSDANFQMLTGNLKLFMDRFETINQQAISQVPPVQETPKQEVVQESVEQAPTTNVQVQPVEEAAPKKTSKAANESPFKGVPLVNTPKIEVPADLDLRNV